MRVIEEGKGEIFGDFDPFAFREFVHKNKDLEMKEKVMTEKEAVERFVKDGDYIGTELYGTVRAPMSLIREVVRQGKKNLRVAGQGILEIDLLLAADLVSEMDIAYVGYEVYGISNILRRVCESGKIKTNDWSNGALAWRFKAAAMGLPFVPAFSTLGTDTFRYSSAKLVECPFTKRKVCLLPALYLDVGFIHVHRADKYGNCQIDGISGFAFEFARACKRLIVSCEELMDNEEIRKEPEKTIIPYYLVDALVLAPYGSHPGEMCYKYFRDEEHIKQFLKLSDTEEGTREYLNKYVYGVKNHEEYLSLIGKERLERLNKMISRR